MPHWMALLLGVVEGLTEFLPVSSTGHLILVAHALHLQDEATKIFEVVIQTGAILAVVVHYRGLLARRVGGLFRREPDSLHLFAALLVAFLPVAIVGLLLRKHIKHSLFEPRPVAWALLVGGLVMLLVETWLARRPRQTPVTHLEGIGFRHALAIGFAQCFALWPGASRAMCTILGGQLAGLSTATAAEFSFLLALPVLGAAAALDLVKGGRTLMDTPGALVAVGIGFVVSFLVAWGVIAVFLRVLRTRGLLWCAIYRIAIGTLVLLLVRP